MTEKRSNKPHDSTMDETIRETLIKSDVLGSYTGRNMEANEPPVQDADDL